MILWSRKKPVEFADILAGLDRAQESPSDKGPFEERFAAEPAAPRMRERLGQVLASLGLTGRSWRWPLTGRAQISDPGAAYAEEADDTPSPDMALPETEPAGTEDEQIAEELGLAKALAKGDLERIRREFAKRNHPDLCPPQLRVLASRRMSIANMLIDEHLKQRRRRR